MVRFTRVLDGNPVAEVGPDVRGVGRALARAGFMSGLATFVDKTLLFQSTYNASKRKGVNRARAKLKLPQNGVYGRRVHDYLVSLNAFDRYAAHLMLDYRPPPTIVYPVPSGIPSARPSFLHPTAGLLGNWALDWILPGGTPIVASEAGVIRKLSGRDPFLGADQLVGIFGWSIHLETPAGYRYFDTHYGDRADELQVGMRIEAGDLLGKVGHWPGDPGRSHLHRGVTSPLGPADAKRRILAVASAERIH